MTLGGKLFCEHAADSLELLETPQEATGSHIMGQG